MKTFEAMRITSPRARRVFVASLAVLAVGVTLLATGWGGSANASPPTRDPTVQGKALVQRFFVLLQNGDTAGLKVLLAPSFQVVRANGGVQGKASYLDTPPAVGHFTIAKVKGTQTGSVLVVSYQVAVSEKIAGAEQPTGWAPRLSVFAWQNGAWHLTAHANFGAITK